jgi:hypothetical protein
MMAEDPPTAPSREAKARAETPAPASPMEAAGYLRAATVQKAKPKSDVMIVAAIR